MLAHNAQLQKRGCADSNRDWTKRGRVDETEGERLGRPIAGSAG
jgi:hypothetical protein